ncbi:hypothetical protein AB0J01_41300 [Streptomyces sp. NPDC050204]|uniref:hypothetical protein n=1 Tax=Streptomyces sp. NPDC050204 TaxID=3155514 RepID=UPI00342C2C08
MPDLTPAGNAPFGYGLSAYDGGKLLHTLAADWTITLQPGYPDILWPEYQSDTWHATAPGRCRRVATWKATAAGLGDGARLCPACQMSDAQRALLDTRIGPPLATRTGLLR